MMFFFHYGCPLLVFGRILAAYSALAFECAIGAM